MREESVNEAVSALVQDATRGIKDAMRENGLVKICFTLHGIDLPSAIFYDDNDVCERCDVTEISLSGDVITLVGEDNNGHIWSGYLDRYYGDWFTVADTIGHLYRAVAEVVNGKKFFDIEKE